MAKSETPQVVRDWLAQQGKKGGRTVARLIELGKQKAMEDDENVRDEVEHELPRIGKGGRRAS